MDNGAIVELVVLSKVGSAKAQELAAAVISDLAKGAIAEREKKQKERSQARKLKAVVCLKDITLKVKKGQFVCIIGKTGSGKSSLLSTICGELMPVPQQVVAN